MKHEAFHWPDHVIGKRESRRIREAHNALYNDFHELVDELKSLAAWDDDAIEKDPAGYETAQCNVQLTIENMTGNAGCDKCGTNDRKDGSKFCEQCD